MEKFVRRLRDAMPRPLCLLDVGARGGIQHPWDRMQTLMSATFVEADPVEAERLRAHVRREDSVLSAALWREETAVNLFLTKSPGCSSVYRPNQRFLNDFPEAERFDIEREITIRADTIDGLVQRQALSQVDFAKLDVQGAELDVLAGGEAFFARNLVGVEIEVEFCPMYEDQPLFSDVEKFVREKLGLELWDIRKTYWKHRAGVQAGSIKGRLVFGDALFLRPLHSLGKWFDEMTSTAAAEKAAMLVVAALAYGYADYAKAILLESAVSKALGPSLAARLQQAVGEVGSGIRPFGAGAGRLFEMLEAAARAVKPAHGGWASIGQSLGSRRRGPFWL